MITACVLLAIKNKQINATVHEIAKLTGVKDVYAVLGRWDAVIWLEVPNNQALDEATLSINNIENVRAIETMVAKTMEGK